MMLLQIWEKAWTTALVNHLWQSTVVVAIVWVLAAAFRKNRARVRYWLWMAASVKFLLPFALLVAAGEGLRSFIPAPAARPALASAVEQMTQPFSAAQFLDVASAPVAPQHASWLLWLVLFTWACGALFISGRFIRAWWSLRAAKRTATPMNLVTGVPVLSMPVLMEPGIYGILRPVLLLPVRIQERLTAEQLQTILAHEMEHVRRRDNLTFAIHMIAETLFWFHPAVWWIGTKLIDERERACDEAVVQEHGATQAYAEGILTVCKFYLESSPACVSGVTGSDLKKRIIRIMRRYVALRLTLGRKILLAAAAVVALVAPLVVGLVCMGQNPAPTGDAGTKPFHFDLVSIHQDPPDTNNSLARSAPDGAQYLPDGLLLHHFPIQFVVQSAFGVPADQIVGLPQWAKTDRYTIQAKVDEADAPRWKASGPQPGDQHIPALQALLADRFSFKAHVEMLPRPVYCLVVANHGPKFHQATPGDTYPNGEKNRDGTPVGRPSANFSYGKVTMQGQKIATLIFALSHQNLGYPVVDQTGLTGEYDLTLHWAPGNTPAPDSSEPPLFTALQEQLGLKLELKKVPIETIVVDHIDRPSPN
jgi:uncharacterized protein (TIGR03435 family)